MIANNYHLSDLQFRFQETLTDPEMMIMESKVGIRNNLFHRSVVCHPQSIEVDAQEAVVVSALAQCMQSIKILLHCDGKGDCDKFRIYGLFLFCHGWPLYNVTTCLHLLPGNASDPASSRIQGEVFPFSLSQH